MACPVTHSPLEETNWRSAGITLGGHGFQIARGVDADDQPGDRALIRVDGSGAYPVVDGIPILMAPEMRAPRGAAALIDTTVDPYREAYEEMDFYNAWAAREQLDVTRSEAYGIVKQAAEAGKFLEPGWLDATYDIAAQDDAYRHIAPLEDGRVLVLGGKGTHAVKFLIAGARESWHATPMLGEAMFARELARAFGVEDRLHCVVAIAEELPFLDETFDRVFSSGCIHHTITDRAFPEIKRVLRNRGKFATCEPWRAALYGVGTKVFGKRERGVNCRPIERSRVEPLFQAFPSAQVMHHGALTRYPLLALNKLGLATKTSTVSKITAIDDRIASVSRAVRKQGSSVSLLATKDEPPVANPAGVAVKPERAEKESGD